MPSYTLLLTQLIAVLGMATPISATRSKLQAPSSCPPFSGTFSVQSLQLYPENLDWDSIHCKLYLSDNFNAAVLVYDPYTKAQTLLTFPFSHVDPWHISGIDFDPRSGLVYFSANSGTPFVTAGANLTGENALIAYNTYTNTTKYIASMDAFESEIMPITQGKVISGFQDQAEDCEGNSYYLASYGNGIAKVNPKGKVSVFYAPPASVVNSSIYGWSGIAAVGPTTLVVADSADGTLLAFDTRQDIDAQAGKVANSTVIPISNLPAGTTTLAVNDAVYAPPKYCNKVLLASNDAQGILVLKSEDRWKTAEYLGLVNNSSPLAVGGSPTATVEIAGSIFISEEFFFDAGVFDVPGNRSAFPLIDITAEVKALVGH